MHPLSTGSMKLIVTSPPYNIGKAYERRTPLNNYVENQKSVMAECVRLLHPNGSLCWQVGSHVQDGEILPLDAVLYPLFKALGLKLRNRIVWHFEHGLHCKKRLSGRYETILWFTKGDDYTFNLDPVRVPSGKKYFKGPKAGQLSCNPLAKNPGDVWIIIKAIIITGYAFTLPAGVADRYPLLLKPLRPTEITSAIERALRG